MYQYVFSVLIAPIPCQGLFLLQQFLITACLLLVSYTIPTLSLSVATVWILKPVLDTL